MKRKIYGKNSVLEALKNNLPIEKLFLLNEPTFEIDRSILVSILDSSEMNKICNENHQGFLAILKEFKYYTLQDILKDQPNVVLILDHIQDPQNLGSILRTANGLGVSHIILPQDRSAKINGTVLKVASGGQVNAKIILVPSLLKAVNFLKNNNFWIYSTGIGEGSCDINDIVVNYPLAVVLGNEGKGVSKTLSNQSDVIFQIPMKGTVQSLNVSVATGIVLYKLTQ